MCPQQKIRIVENPGVAWYALYTRHQHEKNLTATLSRKGFETFLPVYVSARRWADRTKEISLPLFPCYVFVRCAFGGQELQVVTTPGRLRFRTFCRPSRNDSRFRNRCQGRNNRKPVGRRKRGPLKRHGSAAAGEGEAPPAGCFFVLEREKPGRWESGKPAFVGSRTGAALRRFCLSVCSPFPLGVPH